MTQLEFVSPGWTRADSTIYRLSPNGISIILHDSTIPSTIYYYTSERVIRPGIARVCRNFPRAEGEGKYYTRVQYLAVLPSPECNDRFIIYYLQAVLLG